MAATGQHPSPRISPGRLFVVQIDIALFAVVELLNRSRGASDQGPEPYE